MFHHYIMVLSYGSDHFDEILSSGMKEKRTKTIEFLVDRDPEEWKQVYKYFEPSTAQDLKKRNIRMLLPWFTELQLTNWLSRCVDVLRKEILEKNNKFTLKLILQTQRKDCSGEGNLGENTNEHSS